MASLIPVPGDPRPVVDYMARDYASMLRAMHAQIPDRLRQWTDFANEADFGNVLLELFAYLGDVLSYYQDRVAGEAFLGTARTRRSVIEHLRLIGYQLGTAAPASSLLRVSVPADVIDVVTIRQGDAFGARGGPGAPAVRFEYTRVTPLTITFADVPPDARGRRTFGSAALRTGVPVEEGRLFRDQVLGVSDGSPDQRFPIAHPQVIRRPPGAEPVAGDVVVRTRGSSDVQVWTVHDTLALSGHGEHDVTLVIDDADRATLVFGDGTFGAIPPPGAIVTATYRTGGGTVGNVPVGAIDTIVDAPQLSLLGAVVSNLEPGAGAAERETIEHAVRHAPATFRAQGRAVTGADYESLALNFKEVGKVRARAVGWNRIELTVALSGGRGRVSDTLEAALENYFEDKRILGQVIEIVDVDYVPILVTAQIAVQSYYLQAEVVAAVEDAAAALLAFEAVDFDRPIYLSAFYERLQEVPGVSFVNITEFRAGAVSGTAPEPSAALVEGSGRIVLGRQELATVPDDPDHARGVRVVLVPGGAG
jgi:hypothetical protein